MSPSAQQWSLALHLVGVLLWVGGLIGLATLLASHARASASSLADLVKAERSVAMVMELGAVIALVFGIYMLVRIEPSVLKQPWMHIKLTVVVLAILGAHGFLRVALKKARNGATQGISGIVGPVVMIAAAAIVILAIVRPLAK